MKLFLIFAFLLLLLLVYFYVRTNLQKRQIHLHKMQQLSKQKIALEKQIFIQKQKIFVTQNFSKTFDLRLFEISRLLFEVISANCFDKNNHMR